MNLPDGRKIRGNQSTRAEAVRQREWLRRMEVRQSHITPRVCATAQPAARVRLGIARPPDPKPLQCFGKHRRTDLLPAACKHYRLSRRYWSDKPSTER